SATSPANSWRNIAGVGSGGAKPLKTGLCGATGTDQLVAKRNQGPSEAPDSGVCASVCGLAGSVLGGSVALGLVALGAVLAVDQLAEVLVFPAGGLEIED